MFTDCFNNNLLNCNLLNNSITSNQTEYFKKSNKEIPCFMYLENSNTGLKCVKERKKTTIQKSNGNILFNLCYCNCLKILINTLMSYFFD